MGQQRTAALSEEAELLIGCARTTLWPAERTRMRQLIVRRLDWNRVVRLADAHGVLPLLHFHLNRIGSPDPPPDLDTILDLVSLRFLTLAGRCLALVEELRRILPIFESHGIPVVTLKGPILAAESYGHVLLRSYRDLDLLVRKADLFRVRELLHSAGYDHAPASPLPQKAEDLTRYQHLVLKNRADDLLIDLHWRFATDIQFFQADIETLWPRASMRKLAGLELPVLSGEDQLLVLCVHGTRHSWNRLLQISDVAETIRSHPEMSWGSLVRRAERLGVGRMLAVGVLLAIDLLEAPVPERVSRIFKSDSVACSLAAAVTGELFSERTGPTYWREWIFPLRVRSRFRDRLHIVRSLARRIPPPSRLDRDAQLLPESLRSFHNAVRPVRLAASLVSSRSIQRGP